MSWVVVGLSAEVALSGTLTRVCPPGDSAQGLDLSSYQGTPDMARFKGLRRQFVFVKATEGLSLNDSSFESDWEGARAAGLVRGAYHFFHPLYDPIQQADLYLARIADLASDDLPPMLDWEVTDQQPSAQVVQAAQMWLDRVESATGRTPIIYTGPYFWSKLGYPDGFDRYPLFVAQYGFRCPYVPSPWKNWAFWQYAGDGHLGTSNGTDLDMFNGGSDSLQQFLSGAYLPQ